MVKRFFPILSVVVMFALGGCGGGLLGAGEKELTLTERNYRAAETLAQQARGFMPPGGTVQIAALDDVDNPGEQTAFGRMVAQQVGARFVQLGYTVAPQGLDSSALLAAPAMSGSLSGTMTGDSMGSGPDPMMNGGGGYGSGGYGAPYAPPPVYGGSGGVTVTGQYAAGKDEVLVNLKVIDSTGGRVLAAHDYTVPRTRDVKELTRTQADKNSFFGF